ncbi:NADPH-dependent FMN reductase domain-containing protein [Ditylenchus destructor]|nr:NADPH-dependent FMN reductase domain-containing protein [Ditylenchus destructor]
MTAKILIFAGSTRKGAFSGHMAEAASKELAAQGASITHISLADYPLPFMNEDLEAEEGIPENAMKLGRLFAEHDGLMICSPEYNASIPAFSQKQRSTGSSVFRRMAISRSSPMRV